MSELFLTNADLYVPNCIRTQSGNYVNFKTLDPNDIKLRDIVHALYKEQRFGNHLQVEYSVLVHSLLVAMHPAIPKELRLTALLHDASEAFLRDMPTPIKNLLPDYQKLENDFNKMLAMKFGTVYPLPQVVKDVDRELLEIEFKILYSHTNNEYAKRALAIKLKAELKYSIALKEIINCIHYIPKQMFVQYFNQYQA